MTPAYGRDPVTAISEAEATGRTAEIFADIREVMQIPLITSIWRTLVAVEDGLESVWFATRPLYETGQPYAALQELKSRAEFPVPAPPTRDALRVAGVDDIGAVLAVVDAYNRSNGMNLVALSALVSDPSGQPSDFPHPEAPAPWPPLHPLLERDEIDPNTWGLLERIKWLGAVNDSPSIATLWRHLAHWPGLLSLGVEAYEPLQSEGAIERAVGNVRDLASEQAVRIAHFKPSTRNIPADAWDMVSGYSAGVSRMVTMGHGFAQWLREAV